MAAGFFIWQKRKRPMQDFVEIRFPTDIAYGSSGGPAFSTDVTISQNGYEQRNSNWQQARARYNVAHGLKTRVQMDALIAFFRARHGRAVGFRFKDWSDYQANTQGIGVGDGMRREFQLIKRYGSGGQEQIRPILKPVVGSVEVRVNDLLQTSGVSVDTSNGVVSFVTAPVNGAIITASFEFDVPVRFDTDALDVTLEEIEAFTANAIMLVELRLPAASLNSGV
jgi:uncharacterized protein (TIGR02217 family)